MSTEQPVKSKDDRRKASIESLQGGFVLHLINPDTGQETLFTQDNTTSKILDYALDNNRISKEKHHELTSALLQIREREHDTLKNVVGIDPLTGVPNSLYLEPRLEKLIRELNFSSGPKAVMVIALDINNFKVYNELPYNHSIGDQVLYSFVLRLQEVMKEGRDILFRRSGDEFVIVMPILEDNVDFEKLFTDMQERVNKDFFINIADASTLHPKSSVGYSVLKRGEHKTAKELIGEADIMERKNKQKSKS